MPVAPRPNDKAKRIAYNILGKPANLKRQRKNRVKKRIDSDSSRQSG